MINDSTILTAMATLEDRIEDLEHQASECRGMQATLLVNFGPQGRVCSGVADPSKSPSRQLYDVLKWLHDQCGEKVKSWPVVKPAPGEATV